MITNHNGKLIGNRICCRQAELLVITDRMPRSGKLPVLNLITRQKSGFSPAGATYCTDSRQTWQDRRTRGSVWLCKISPQSPQGVGMRPQKYQKFPLFGKESPRRGDSLDRFPKCLGAFIRLTLLCQCFKFHVIYITGYGVIAEKPRVGKNGQIFPCTLQEKLYVGSKNGCIFYDVHDELYHHAKFGEDRTMRAGCRCENVVFGSTPQR